jgi:uncharacterized repeat protein (TIGR01451 family)
VTERTYRWRGAVGATVLLAAMGVGAGRGTLILAALIPLAYVAYGSLSATEVPDDLRVERTIEPSPVPPGHPVTVTVRVRNESDRTLPDVRIVDAVPDELAVVEGSPRGAAALDPGERLTVEYVLAARRGEYDFDPPQVRLRSLGAGAVTTEAVEPTGDTRLVCRLEAEAPPIEDQGDRYVGQLSTDRPGPGLEFHSTREYRPEDPAQRIDWRHYAKRNELATINYNQRLAATVVLVVDARAPAHVAAGPGRPTAVERSAYAATRAMTDLMNQGHDVGVAVVGDWSLGPAGVTWLPQGGGQDHRSRVLDTFEDAVDATPGASDLYAAIGRVSKLTPPGAQVVWFSPLLDDGAVEPVESWAATGIPCSVLSPDVLTENTVSGQFEQVQRRTRLARCQAIGARTVDWRRGTPLPVVLDWAFAAANEIADRAGATGGSR